VRNHRWREVTASALRLTVGLDHGCAAKMWATAPRLKGGGARGLDGQRHGEEPWTLQLEVECSSVAALAPVHGIPSNEST
jgi:hypothetical protein